MNQFMCGCVLKQFTCVCATSALLKSKAVSPKVYYIIWLMSELRTQKLRKDHFNWGAKIGDKLANGRFCALVFYSY